MCLHQWDVRGPDDGVELAEELIHTRTAEADIAEFARQLLRAYWDHRVEVDERIARVATNWSLERLAIVDRNVLRLAVAELLFVAEVPSSVTLDEAIEIAKRFSTEQSGAFVNGILDRILAEEEKRGAR